MSRVDEIKAAIVQCYCCTNTYGESCSAVCSDCENELEQDLDALIAEARAEVVEEALSVVEWDGYTLDIKKRIEQLKEQKND